MPVIEDCVHGNLGRRKQSFVWLLVLNQDVVVGGKRSIPHAPLPRQKLGRIFFKNVVVVHAGVVYYGAEGDPNHDLHATMVVFAAVEKDALQGPVCADVGHVDVSTIENSCKSFLKATVC